jgi:hypothetical protein
MGTYIAKSPVNTYANPSSASLSLNADDFDAIDGTRTMSKFPRLPAPAQLIKCGRKCASIPTIGNTAAPRPMPRTTFNTMVTGTGHHDLSFSAVTEVPRDTTTKAGKKQ